jgi:FkbM family methyltransferase
MEQSAKPDLPGSLGEFDEVAPVPVPEWKIRLVSTAMRVPPMSSKAVRSRLVRAWRARQRSARAKAIARGEREFLRPALYGMADAIDRHLDPSGGGFFIEAGANDGYTQSNTYHLEYEHGWKGLLVEPVPSLYQEVLVERPGATVVNCALVPFGHPDAEVEMHYGGLMSLVSGSHGADEDDTAFAALGLALGLEDPYTFRAPARPLSDVLDEIDAPEIDFLSLDVEGYEPFVLRGLDLDRHAPRFLLCEMHDLDAGRRAVEDVLGPRYEAIEQVSPLDLLYRRV